MTEDLRQQSVFKMPWRLLLESAGVGLLVGTVVTAFRWCLDIVESARGTVLEKAATSMPLRIIALAVLVAAFVIIIVTLKFAPGAGGSGLAAAKRELSDEEDRPWLLTLIGKFIGTIAAIGSGLSLGRAGPSLQIGAMLGKGLSQISGKSREEEKQLMIAGGGAGLTAIFGAPLTGTVFALEGLAKRFGMTQLMATGIACLVAEFVSSRIFGLTPLFRITTDTPLPPLWHLSVIPLAFLTGILGWLFSWLLQKGEALSEKVSGTALKILGPFLLVVPVAFWYPWVLGSGHDLVEWAQKGVFLLPVLPALLLVKFAFSQVCMASGVPGGIIFPTLITGALFGALFGMLVGPGMTNLGDYILCGMAGMFAVVLDAPLTAIILPMELVGNFNNLPALVLASFLAYGTGRMLFRLEERNAA